MKQKKNIARTALIVLIITVLAGYSIEREKVLLFTGERGEKEIIIAVPNRVFTLKYIHSVHHTPVYESFYVCDDNTLVLRELRFSSLGVGMPYSREGGTFETIDGEYVLRFERMFQAINMIVSPIPEHIIIVGERDYPLLNFTRPEGPLEIRAIDRWSFRFLRLGKKGA